MNVSRSIRRNIIANTAGRLWAAISNVIFVPLFIGLLGGDGYGLIVAYATLFATLQVLDAGLSSALSRELSLRLARTDDASILQSSVDLMKTVERISLITGGLAGLAIVAAAPYLASDWLVERPELRPVTLQSIRLIGAIVAVQWPSMAYQGALMGMQAQVAANAARVASSTVQAVGALVVLQRIAASPLAFFCWALLVQAMNTFCLRRMVWLHLKRVTTVHARFQWAEVTRVWRFAGGVATIALLSALLTQTDKIVLSKFVPISEFGVYGVAYTLAGVLGLLAQPILASLLPRLTQLFDARRFSELLKLYNGGCELIALFVIPCWMILFFHPGDLMSLWMGANEESRSVARLLPLLASGTLANALVTLPYGVQLASGWTSLSVVKNVITVMIAVPVLLFAIPRYGSMGAAAIWFLINCGYLFIEIPVMHGRLPIGSLRAWYWRVLILPLLWGGLIGMISRQMPSPASNKVLLFANLSFWFLITALLLGLSMPGLRAAVRNQWRVFRPG